MGIYFFKSTDLPKELKEKSAQMRAQTGDIEIKRNVKMSFPNLEKNEQREQKIVATIDTAAAEAKLKEMKLQKKAREVQMLNAEIDRLTMEITTLEQQIKDNNAKNAEIQAQIDTHLVTLLKLQEQITLLG